MTKMFKNRLLRSAYFLLAVVLLCSHDLYLKMETYFLPPHHEATLSLYNGTFEKGENIITRDRMLDASFVALGSRVPIDSSQWQDQDSTITYLQFQTGAAGTYVAGVSTRARNIILTAKKFNSYLKHDGVLDMLEQRTNDGLLDQDAVESYQKHVKAIYQVGETKTNDWQTVLGYPIEFVPEANPYERYSGEKLSVKLLLEGAPLPNQLVYADYIGGPGGSKYVDYTHEHDGTRHSHRGADHDHDAESEEEHSHTGGQQLRTNAEGVVTVDLPADGIYYLRTIHMETVSDTDELTHRSKWATLTFEVTHKHGADTHTHDDHDHEEDIPIWIFVVGSLILVSLLFLIFRKNS